MRGTLRTLIAGAAVLGLAACSDSATAPRDAASSARLAPDAPSLTINPASRFDGSQHSTFVLTAAGGTYTIGNVYTVSFPSNSVCVLGSTYGPGTWDTPCQTLHGNESIAVTATYELTGNGLAVSFQPEIRFNPNTTVTLSTGIYSSILTNFRWLWLANPGALRSLGIYYIDNLNSTPVIDAATDPSLRTYINLTTGQVYRRVKHFSGYNVTAGDACNITDGDPACQTVSPVVVP